MRTYRSQRKNEDVMVVTERTEVEHEQRERDIATVCECADAVLTGTPPALDDREIGDAIARLRGGK